MTDDSDETVTVPLIVTEGLDRVSKQVSANVLVSGIRCREVSGRIFPGIRSSKDPPMQVALRRCRIDDDDPDSTEPLNQNNKYTKVCRKEGILLLDYIIRSFTAVQTAKSNPRAAGLGACLDGCLW